MSDNGDENQIRQPRGYGSTGQTVHHNVCSTGDDEPPDIFCVNDLMIHNVNERYINRIREQSGLSNGPAMVNFQIARSRRRPIVRTKSEHDLGALVDEDVEAIRDRLVKRYGKTHQRYVNVLKGVPKFTRQQWLVLASVALVDFTSFCAMSILAPFFPSEAAKKGVSTSISGFVFSVYALVVFLCSPFMGVVVGHVGPKFLLILGVFLGGSCNLLFGVLDQVQSTPVFITYCFLVRIFEALGAAMFATASYTFVANIFPDNIGAVLGILETFVGLGLAVGPAIGGLLYDLGGYSLPFVSLGAVMLATIPINIYLLPSTGFEEDPTLPKGSMWKLLKIPPVFVICLVIIIASNTWGFLDPTLAIHLSEFNLSAKELGLFFLLNSFLYAASSPLWGYVADKMERTWILMFAGLLLNTFGLMLLGPSPFLPFSNTIWLNVVSLIILGTSIAMTLLPTFEAILDLSLDAGYGDDTSTYGLIAGLWSSMYSLGEVIGPSLGGFLLEQFDFPISSTVMAALSFLLAMFVLMYFSTIKAPYESQLSQSSKDGQERTPDVDSGISDNVNGVTSRSSSSTSVADESEASNAIIIPADETTPLLLSRSLDRQEAFAINISKPIASTSNLNEFKVTDYGQSFGSFPDILKTISITGAGAVEV